MPDSFMNNQPVCTDDSAPPAQTHLNRRNFLSLASSAAAGLGLMYLLKPSQAYAVTSAEKQAEADAVRRKMDDWDVQLEGYANTYNNAVDAYNLAVASMEAAQARIDAAVARQYELQSQLSQRVRTMYKQGPLSFMDVIFGANDFIEFSTSWDLLNTINSKDAELINQWQAAQAEAEEARAEYARQEQVALQKLAEAEEANSWANAVMASYQSELDSLEAEVRQLIDEERRAEEERLQREQEERRRAEGNSGGGSRGGNPGGYVPYDGSRFGSIVEAAYSRLGCPYVWADVGPDSFDCSGLTYWCYRQIGKTISRGGDAQYSSAPMRMAVSEAQPGDILWKPGHVGIYIGGGSFIHAPSPGYVVCVGNVASYPWVGASRW